MLVWIEDLKKCIHCNRIPVRVFKPPTESKTTGKNVIQGKGDKGQKGRYIFTPFHTSTEACRGFYICDSTGREHTHTHKKKKREKKHK